MRSKGTQITCVAGASCVYILVFNFFVSALFLGRCWYLLDLVIVVFLVALLPSVLWGESACLQWVSCV